MGVAVAVWGRFFVFDLIFSWWISLMILLRVVVFISGGFGVMLISLGALMLIRVVVVGMGIGMGRMM